MANLILAHPFHPSQPPNWLSHDLLHIQALRMERATGDANIGVPSWAARSYPFAPSKAELGTRRPINLLIADVITGVLSVTKTNLSHKKDRK